MASITLIRLLNQNTIQNYTFHFRFPFRDGSLSSGNYNYNRNINYNCNRNINTSKLITNIRNKVIGAEINNTSYENPSDFDGDKKKKI